MSMLLAIICLLSVGFAVGFRDIPKVNRATHIICGNCDYLTNPKDCLTFKKCHVYQVTYFIYNEADQTCKAERKGHAYNLKCEDKSVCADIDRQNSGNKRFVVSNSNAECCYSDFCNTKLFKQDFMTTAQSTESTTTMTTITTTTSNACADIVGVNCAKLQNVTNVCIDAPIASKFCRKTCNLC